VSDAGAGALDVRTILSDTAKRYYPISSLAMDKRDKFIAELRDEARKKGLPFRAEKWRGKGGHMMVFVGDRLTTVPSREIDPKTARKIRKQLGLAD
jgi:hypothetical protein